MDYIIIYNSFKNQTSPKEMTPEKYGSDKNGVFIFIDICLLL